ncbi:unnamed protein product [Urochloa humidicola]
MAMTSSDLHSADELKAKGLTIRVSDAITMGNWGMCYSLQSLTLLAYSIKPSRGAALRLLPSSNQADAAATVVMLGSEQERRGLTSTSTHYKATTIDDDDGAVEPCQAKPLLQRQRIS